jgi:hypothetical protein
LTLIQILDLAVDWRSLAGFRTAALPLHLLGILNAGFCAVALRTTIGKPLWRQLALVTFLNLFVIMAALAITMGTAEPLILTVAFAMLGGAALVPWEESWQMADGRGRGRGCNLPALDYGPGSISGASLVDDWCGSPRGPFRCADGRALSQGTGSSRRTA